MNIKIIKYKLVNDKNEIISENFSVKKGKLKFEINDEIINKKESMYIIGIDKNGIEYSFGYDLKKINSDFEITSKDIPRWVKLNHNQDLTKLIYNI